MRGRWSLVTPPATEPVTLVQAKNHLRVDITDDDDLINDLIETSRRALEDAYDVIMMPQTWDVYYDAWPSFPFKLTKWPLQSITSISYVDSAGASTAWATSNYLVDTASRTGRIVLKTGGSFPSVTLQEANAIVVRAVVGYADEDDVPAQLKRALLLMVGDLYEIRENIQISERARVAAEDLKISSLLAMNHRSFHF